MRALPKKERGSPGRTFSPAAFLTILLVTSLGALALCVLGCASSGSRSVERSDLARTLRARGIDPATIILPYELTPEMKVWVHKTVSEGLPVEERLKRLLQALLDPHAEALTYEAHFTGTAAESFASHRANCLAFTNLFVGMARELGVPAFYLDVDDVQKFEKEGDLVVVSGHISAGFGSGRELKILDFSAAPTVSYRSIRQISDQTAIALYYSNRGGELLRAGQHREALTWLRTATVLDPDLARAWINLGVAQRRNADLPGAEASYRRALEIDPEAISAYQNLASLLRLRGRPQEADELLALTGRLASRNPYNLLNLGDLALAHGRLEEAHGFYKRALRLYAKNAEPYAALGLWAKAAGNQREARKWYRKALALDADNDRVRVLATELGETLDRPARMPAASSVGAEALRPADLKPPVL
ncbi:MAG TPA: tetratricopeptide repeat protein [Thermoanaerobaculia bacterium]|nr:tetratricopeptide repeat protein [Thermoanaerobaculia bacterium]